MKKVLQVLVASSIFLWCSVSHADFNSNSTGSDGPFNPPANANTVVTLPPSGILNYTTVNIPAGATVTFQKNATNTPVYMLAQGDVIIAGTISVNGGNGSSSPGQGGPGGFNGGAGGTMYDLGGKGLGPGGGFPGPFNGSCPVYYSITNAGGGGGFGTAGGTACGAGGGTYGNARLFPLIGGSGGGGQGGPVNPSRCGAGGGGAILIASSGNITVNGSITANGGSPVNSGGDTITNGGGGGSGGGIRLIANAIYGNGSLTAIGGGAGSNIGGGGRIRLETYSNATNLISNPSYSFGSPSSVFASAQPSLTINSIVASGSTYNAPANPAASYTQPDILLPNTTTNPVTVNISAANIPTTTTINVRVIPQYGADSTYPVSLTGTQQASTASASVTLSTTYTNVITAEATFTVMAMYYDGEEINKVHVATTMGGKAETTYYTKSGKIIKGELIAALVK